MRPTGYTEYKRRVFNTANKIGLDIERSGDEYVKLTVIDFGAQVSSQISAPILSTIVVRVDEFIAAASVLREIIYQDSI